MTATLSAKPPIHGGPSRGNGQGEQRDLRLELRGRISSLELQARSAAEAGEIAQSARMILAALDCERRLAATGPQVLQLIKPRP
ncbi:MAG: hypothetical protein AAFX65_03015 [Cyanobacteria bacterium J06638_7]